MPSKAVRRRKRQGGSFLSSLGNLGKHVLMIPGNVIAGSAMGLNAGIRGLGQRKPKRKPRRKRKGGFRVPGGQKALKFLKDHKLISRGLNLGGFIDPRLVVAGRVAGAVGYGKPKRKVRSRNQVRKQGYNVMSMGVISRRGRGRKQGGGNVIRMKF